MKRLDRAQFFEKVAGFDEERLRKALWNLYWRGSAILRERIEAELHPELPKRRRGSAGLPLDPELVASEVEEFVDLARSGAYRGGDRRVSPGERTRWRSTFKRLATDAQRVLPTEEIGQRELALEQLVGLACELRDWNYFHSEDAVEAAGFVVSDAAALLWRQVRDRAGFAAFARRAAPQLIAWESRFGWTRRGDGRVSEKESPLTEVLVPLLWAPDLWVQFADRYLDALDGLAGRHSSNRPGRAAAWNGNLASWHHLLLDRLAGTDAEDRLDRLAGHSLLVGGERSYFSAQLAHRRGDDDRARRLAHDALEELPGADDYLSFAVEIGAPVPAIAERVARGRGTWPLVGDDKR